jgi:hypothetical protein
MDNEFRRNVRVGIVVVAVIGVALALYCLFAEMPFGFRNRGLNNPGLWIVILSGVALYVHLLKFPGSPK